MWNNAGLRLNSERGLFSFVIVKPDRPSYYSAHHVTDQSVRKQWKLIWERRGHGAMFPYWFLVLVFGGLAISPWTTRPKLRFSLRTLLIATTLVAVALGLIVWAVR
jgi:hypothetical protein